MRQTFWLAASFLAWFGFSLALLHLTGADQWLASGTASIASILLDALGQEPVALRVSGDSLIFSTESRPVVVDARYLNLQVPLFVAIVSTVTRRYGTRFLVTSIVGCAVLVAVEALNVTAEVSEGLAIASGPLDPLLELFSFFSAGGWSAAVLFVGAFAVGHLATGRETPDSDCAL